MIGIAFELVGTSALKLSDGFTKTVPTTVCLLGFGVAFYALSKAVQDLPIGVVYAIWSGAGIALITLIGWFVFGEALSMTKVFFIGLIIAGVIGLQISTQSH